MFRTPVVTSSIRLLMFWGLAVAQAHGAEPYAAKSGVANAAAVYWQSFSLLPNLTEGEQQLLDQLEKGQKPIEQAQPILDRSNGAMDLLRHIKPDVPCRWEIIRAGPYTMLPHLGKARLLARLLALRARFAMNAGDRDAAVDDIARALLVARNVDEGSLIHLLVGNSIESLVIDTSRPMLKDFNQADHRRLAESLSKLPTRPKFADALVYERDLSVGWLKSLVGMDVNGIRPHRKAEPDIAAFLGGTRKEQARRIEALEALYDRMIAASKLPPDQSVKQLVKIEAEVQEASDPLIRQFMPSMARARQRHAAIEAKVAEFERSARDAEKKKRTN